MDNNSYLQKAEDVAAELQEYLKSDKWHPVREKETESFRIYSMKSKYFSGHLYKGEAEFNAPPQTVFEYVDPLPLAENGKRAEWDKNMKKIEILDRLDSTKLRINRACTDSACMGLISARDFVDLIIIKETDTYISTNAVSISRDDVQTNGHVRGWNHPCGMIVFKVPDNPNKCKLISLIQPDIKGNVPKSLTDAAIPGSMAEFFNSLSAALKKDNQLVS